MVNFLAFIVMACVVMAYVVMACVGVACIVMAYMGWKSFGNFALQKDLRSEEWQRDL